MTALTGKKMVHEGEVISSAEIAEATGYIQSVIEQRILRGESFGQVVRPARIAAECELPGCKNKVKSLRGRFCERKCNYLNQKRLNAVRRPCQAPDCDNEVVTVPSVVSDGGGHYCSTGCSNKWCHPGEGIVHKGKRLTLTEIAEAAGISLSVVSQRKFRGDASFARLARPVRPCCSRV